MKLTFFVLLVAVSFALSLEKKNQQLKRTNGALLQALKELTTSSEAKAEKAIAQGTEEKAIAVDKKLEKAIAQGTEENRLERAIADGWESYSGPSKDCSSFNSQCRGCRGYLASCCSNMNCASGRKCVAGLWSYSCDNTAEEEKAIAEEKKLAGRGGRGRGLLLRESI